MKNYTGIHIQKYNNALDICKKTEWYKSVELIRQSKKDCWQKELDGLILR